MAKETILIGCRLPNGLVLHHPKNRNLTVKLAGTYETKLESGLFVPPRPYTLTPVDAEFWAEWKAAYVGFPKAKDTAKTGFEPMSKSAVIDGVKLEQAVS
jgi:hypothetical protein